MRWMLTSEWTDAYIRMSLLFTSDLDSCSRKNETDAHVRKSLLFTSEWDRYSRQIETVAHVRMDRCSRQNEPVAHVRKYHTFLVLQTSALAGLRSGLAVGLSLPDTVTFVGTIGRRTTILSDIRSLEHFHLSSIEAICFHCLRPSILLNFDVKWRQQTKPCTAETTRQSRTKFMSSRRKFS